MRIEEALSKLDEGCVMSRGDKGVGVMRSARVRLPKETVKKMFGVEAQMTFEPSLLSLSKQGVLSPYIITTEDLNANDWRVTNLSLGESATDAIKHRGFVTVDEGEIGMFYTYMIGHGLGEVIAQDFVPSTNSTRFLVESVHFSAFNKEDGIPNYTLVVDEVLEKVVFVREV